MNRIDEAMIEHMANIVFSEHRPFSFRDFLCFEVDGNEYRMTAGTFRNKITKLRKSGDVELEYNSGTAFYTLKGHRFGKPMTPNHTGVNSNKVDPFIKLIQGLPMGRNAVHDIRLRFEVKGIWIFLSTYYSGFPINHNSNDILIPTYNIDGLLVRVTVHKTDTVSVTMACSLEPVSADISGIIRLSNVLARVEERLAALLPDRGETVTSDFDLHVDRVWNNHLRIPDHKNWIVTMWHLGLML